MASLPCPCKPEITGIVKVIENGMATGPLAEQAAIAQARKDAESEAQAEMAKQHCDKPCRLAFKPHKVVIRSSGSQNNPAFPIVGEAVAVWTIYPICSRLMKKKKKKKSSSVPLTTPAAPGASRYPFTKDMPCGTITISISKGTPGVDDGAIVFDFKERISKECDCEEFGWIQHFRRGNGRWRYDNGMHPSTTGRRIGAPSDPSQTIQPTEKPAGADFGTWPENPWYGAFSGPNAPAGFDRAPKPQKRIGDKPDDRDTSFITQLVCVDDGEVYFSWAWGPVPDGRTPLETVPAGPTRPP